MERKIFICGDSYAAPWARENYHFKNWYQQIPYNVNHGQGGSPWDYTAHKLYTYLDPVVHSAVICSITNGHRIWFNHTVRYPWKSSLASGDREVRNMVRNFSEVPEWDNRQVVSALTVLKNISLTVPVFVIAPFLELLDRGPSLQRYRDSGLWPTATPDFYILPVDLQRLGNDANSSHLPNHLPPWAHDELARVIRNWYYNRNTSLQHTRLRLWHYKNIGGENER